MGHGAMLGGEIVSHKRSSKIVTPKDEWGTPQWLFDLLDQEFHFDLDGACTRQNCLCDHGAFVGEFDPLSWTPTWMNVFLNPPYSAGNIDKFMQKAHEESQKGAVVVCLVPCATDTKWWHNYAMKAQEIRFIKGRVRFVGYDEEGNQVKNSPTFSSCVVIFKPQWSQDCARFVDPSQFTPRIGKTIEQPKRVKA
jgi:site-specific DNA-methyltransferase (adenine-specific)